jgi:exopolysaccharide biosynthesis polyprenyl glycosylphosphotransferase
VKRFVQILTYLLALMTPVAIGYDHATRVAIYEFGTRPGVGWLVGYGAMYCLAAFLFGVPTLVERWNQAALSSALAVAVPVALASMFLVVYDPFIPRRIVLWTPVILFVVFFVLSGLHASIWRRSGQNDRVLAVLTDDERKGLERDLERPSERNCNLVAVLDPAACDADPRSLEDLAEETQANLIVLSELSQNVESVVAQAAQLHEQGMRIRSLLTFYDEWLGKYPVSELARTSLWFDIRDIHEVHYSRLKRLMDVVIAVAMLPVLAIATLAVVLVNRFTNRGPTFFKQQRVGQQDNPFTIWKFRTMVVDNNSGGAGRWTTENDPRVTPFGKILRVTHVDELPQLVNVLLGDLSIVGPRPEQPHYVAELTKRVPFYGMRHIVKPGVTGWAQVKYPYGASELDAIEKLQYELYYLRHQSLSLDVRICGRTLRTMLFREGR